MNNQTQTVDATIRELEVEIENNQTELNNLKYADYELAKKEYLMALENYQECYKHLMEAEQKYILEMKTKIRTWQPTKSVTEFFMGRAF